MNGNPLISLFCGGHTSALTSLFGSSRGFSTRAYQRNGLGPICSESTKERSTTLANFVQNRHWISVPVERPRNSIKGSLTREFFTWSCCWGVRGAMEWKQATSSQPGREGSDRAGVCKGHPRGPSLSWGAAWHVRALGLGLSAPRSGASFVGREKVSRDVCLFFSPRQAGPSGRDHIT